MKLVSNRGRLAWRAAFFLAGATYCAAQDEGLAKLSNDAKQLMAQGKFEQAIPICEELVKAVPGNTGLVLNLGLAEEMAGHPDKAVPLFEQVLKTEPGNVPALTELASSRMELNQPKLALVPLQKLLSEQPANHGAREMLAGALTQAGELEEAAEQYRKLTSADAADAKAWYGLGKTYESLSEQLFERISKGNTESPYAAALIGYSRLSQQQYKSAFFFFHQAEQKLPHVRGLHAALAKIYQETGHADWAAVEEKAEESLPAPNCAAAPAECAFVQNHYLESAKAGSKSAAAASLFWAVKAYNQMAIEAFSRLGALPESVELHALKAQILHGHKQDLEAANEWRAALKLAPANKRLEGELARALFLAHDYKGAMELVQKLLAADGGSPQLNFMMGESLLRTEQPGEALPYLERALHADSKLVPAHASLGLALAQLNRGGEAISHLEKALQLDDDGSLHYALARAYQQAGNAERARDLMAEYQRIQKQNGEQKEELAKEIQIAPPARN